MQTKKLTQNGTDIRTEEAKARPEGMQTMSTTLYAQLRRVLVELKLVSEN
jgi:hypothetical protein